MKKKFLIAFAVFMVCTFFISCTKTGPGEGFNNNDLVVIPWNRVDSTCDPGYSAQFYYGTGMGQFDLVRRYDEQGRKELICAFFDDKITYTEIDYDMAVVQNNSTILLIDRKNSFDTLMKITLNNSGRVQSYQSMLHLSWVNLFKPESGTFVYKNNRLYSRNVTTKDPDLNITYNFSDTFHYDMRGNILSHLANSYQYDYSRKGTQQYYDDYIDNSTAFAVLQYLTLFPELTCPPNVRTHVASGAYNIKTHVVTPVFDIPLLNHQFDSNGNLIFYDAGTTGNTVQVVWSCSQLNEKL